MWWYGHVVPSLILGNKILRGTNKWIPGSLLETWDPPKCLDYREKSSLGQSTQWLCWLTLWKHFPENLSPSWSCPDANVVDPAGSNSWLKVVEEKRTGPAVQTLPSASIPCPYSTSSVIKEIVRICQSWLKHCLPLVTKTEGCALRVMTIIDPFLMEFTHRSLTILVIIANSSLPYRRALRLARHMPDVLFVAHCSL